jgi:hypothetical protein
MSKTPEQLANEWAIDWHKDCDYPDAILEQTHAATMDTFLAGYEAAQERYEARIKELEVELENWQHNATHGNEGL